MSDPQLLELVHKMRNAQKAYFKNRLNRDLQESKELEKAVDYQLSRRVVAQMPADKESTGKLF